VVELLVKLKAVDFVFVVMLEVEEELSLDFPLSVGLCILVVRFLKWLRVNDELCQFRKVFCWT
jgi:hypothetical protein